MPRRYSNLNIPTDELLSNKSPMASKFTYDGPLLTREEFLRGDPGVHRVEGQPIIGHKKVNCTTFFRHGFWSTDICTVPVEVPAGEYIVMTKHSPHTPLRNARATGINIPAAPAILITSAYRPPYIYNRSKLNTPGKFHGGCTEDEFFRVDSAAVCGMHFTFKRAE